jgi:glycosyltransferase involved in cell wall biosynthesis
MRILYIHQHFSTPKGSAGIRSYMMAQQLIKNGHQVTMLCGSYGVGDTGLNGPFQSGLRKGNVAGIDVVEFDLSYSNAQSFWKRVAVFLRFAMGCVRLALRENYDILFATSTPLTVGIPALLARFLRGKPYIFEVRDLWPELPKAMGVIRNPVLLGLMSALEWLSYRFAMRCIGLAPGMVEGIAKRGTPREKIALIPNGCDIEIFASGIKNKWRPEGVEPDDLMAVYAGTHGMANGLSALVEAAAILQKRNKTNIKIVLLGEGKEKPKLQAQVADLQLQNIIFHSAVNKDRVAGILAAADIGIQSLANFPAFYFGTSPNKFFDYLSSGLPVLTNYPGWVADLITKFKCGFAVPPDDPLAFADKLEYANDHREKLHEMRDNSIALANGSFDRNVLAQQWVNWVVHGVKP